MMNQNITYDIAGQELVLDVLEGRPTGTPSYAVYNSSDGDEATAEFSGSGSIDSVSTVTTALVGQTQTNRKLVTLSSVSGIEVGREYLITSTTGETEWLEVVSIDTGDLQLVVRSPIQNVYAVGSTFASTRITADVDATWVADSDNLRSPDSGDPDYRVIWTFTYDSKTMKRYTYFDLVRVQQTHNVKIDDLIAFAPTIKDVLARDFRGKAEPLLDEAYRSLVLDLKAADVDIDIIRDQFVVDELVKRGALYLVVKAGHYPQNTTFLDYLEVVRKEYETAVAQHITVVGRTAAAYDSDGSTTKGKRPTPYWVN